MKPCFMGKLAKVGPVFVGAVEDLSMGLDLIAEENLLR